MESELMDLETQWMNAWKERNEPAARSFLADDFTLASSLSTGELVNKEQWIEKAMHNYECRNFRIEKLVAKQYGNTAIVTLWFFQDATANGQDWSGLFLLTDIWVHQNDRWQVVTRHSSWLKR